MLLLEEEEEDKWLYALPVSVCVRCVVWKEVMKTDQIQGEGDA